VVDRVVRLQCIEREKERNPKRELGVSGGTWFSNVFGEIEERQELERQKITQFSKREDKLRPTNALDSGKKLMQASKNQYKLFLLCLF